MELNIDKTRLIRIEASRDRRLNWEGHFVLSWSHTFHAIQIYFYRPALTTVWPKAPPLTVRCLSPLPGFESRPGHVRK